MKTTTILSLSNISRAYRAGIPGCGASIEVLSSVSLQMQPGDFVLIEGLPGCGKTTLLLCAAGLLRPDSGTIQWPALARRTTQAPKAVRYVGDRATTYGFLTVRESLAYAATLREIDEPRAQQPRNDPIETAGLTALTGTRVALLSRGERARFLVALALVSDPSLLLVDDLTADCDAVAYAALAECLSRVADTGPGVLWAARSVGAVNATPRSYELVRGKLRERTGMRPVTRPPHIAPLQTGVTTGLRATPRVAEP